MFALDTFTSITWVILGILVFDFLIERSLAYLNASNVKTELPTELEGLYDKEEYAKQQSYFKTNQRFGLLTGILSFVLVMLMFVFGGFSFVDGLAHGFTTLSLIVSLIFFGIIFFANDIISIPFDVYNQFVIEEKFGFNKMTVKTFVLDKLKGWLLGAIIGGGLVLLIQFIYTKIPDFFWLAAWLVLAGFSIFMFMFYSDLIVPLFNKQTPLEEGELRTEIDKFATKVGFKLNNIYVIDGSKRSTKANAYFTGLGAKKRVVLYDTLINDLNADEIVAVLAHEIGHYKKKHTLVSLVMSLANSLLMLYVLGLFLNNDALAQAFGVEKAAFHINILAFGLLYTPVSWVLSIFMNMVIRKNEYQADAYAAEYGLGESLLSGLKKLSVKSLSNLQPHPLYVFFYYSHPTLLQRIKAVRSL